MGEFIAGAVASLVALLVVRICSNHLPQPVVGWRIVGGPHGTTMLPWYGAKYDDLWPSRDAAMAFLARSEYQVAVSMSE